MTHFLSSVEKTRLANATAYTANDVISEHGATGTVWAFTGFPAGGAGYLVKARIITDEVTGMTPRLRLYLFNAAPTGELDDNLANTEPMYADRASMIGTIDFDALDNSMSGADSSESQRDDLRLEFACAAGSGQLSGILVTLDAFTPASAQLITINLVAEV